ECHTGGQLSACRRYQRCGVESGAEVSGDRRRSSAKHYPATFGRATRSAGPARRAVRVHPASRRSPAQPVSRRPDPAAEKSGFRAIAFMKVMLVIPHVSGGGGEKVLSELACNLRAETVVVVFEEKFSYPVRGKVISLNAPINRSSAIARAWGFLRRIV